MEPFRGSFSYCFEEYILERGVGGSMEEDCDCARNCLIPKVLHASFIQGIEPLLAVHTVEVRSIERDLPHQCLHRPPVRSTGRELPTTLRTGRRLLIEGLFVLVLDQLLSSAIRPIKSIPGAGPGSLE